MRALVLVLLPTAGAAVPAWQAPELVGDALGAAVSGGGDVDGDGWDDVVVGGWDPTVDRGAAWVVPGGPEGPSATRAWALPAADDALGFGAAVALLGDVDGDGFADLAVGAWAADDAAGRVYLYRGGPDGPTPWGVWAGAAADDFFGRYLAAAGDVDGDGHADVLVSAPHAGDIAGAVYLFAGGPDGLSATPAAVLTGDAPGDALGTAVGGAGDVDGDGYADVLVASQGWSDGTGRVGWYAGGPTGLDPTPRGWLEGETTEDYFGVGVSGGGDVDGDGWGDVVVGAWGWERSSGRAYLFRGGPAGLDPVATVARTGAAEGDAFGRSVAVVGDVDGDGRDDVVVGADGVGVEEGRAYLFLGTADGMGEVAVTLSFEAAHSDLGAAVARAGDTDGDGLADVIAGGPGFAGGAGRADVYAGSDRGLRSAPLTTLVGVGPESAVGAQVGSAGDVDGDGWDDLFVGAEHRVYLHRGGPTGPEPAASWVLWGDDRDFGAHVAALGDVDADGFADLAVGSPRYGGVGRVLVYRGGPDGPTLAVTLGVEAGLGGMGTAVAGPGDVDGDGYADLVVGASDWSGRTGRAWLYAGGPDGVDRTPRATLSGEAEEDRFGDTLAAAGDLDGDGAPDLLVGAPGAGGGAGRVLVFLGGPDGLAPAGRVEGGAAGDALGSALAGLGDLDGDGRGDVALGAPGADGDAGRVEVRFGAARGLEAARSARLLGREPGDRFGAALAAPGDENGDGLAELAVGAPGAAAGAGRVHRFAGTPGGPVEGAALDGSEGDGFGGALGAAGDADGDGLLDLLVGSPTAGEGRGAAALYPGRADWDADGAAAPADCDDLDPGRSPGLPERCDPPGVDEDCDGLVDDADPSVEGGATWHIDGDGDGYTAGSVTACAAPDGALSSASATPDCDDADPGVHPGATDVPRDGVDQDCDGADASGPSRDSLPIEEGCGCASGPAPTSLGALLAAAWASRRRRRPACAPRAD